MQSLRMDLHPNQYDATWPTIVMVFFFKKNQSSLFFSLRDFLLFSKMSFLTLYSFFRGLFPSKKKIPFEQTTILKSKTYSLFFSSGAVSLIKKIPLDQIAISQSQTSFPYPECPPANSPF